GFIRCIALPAAPPSPEHVLAAGDAAPNHMQQALARFTATLPAGSATAADRIDLARLTGEIVGAEAADTVKEALEAAETGLTRFLHGPGSSKDWIDSGALADAWVGSRCFRQPLLCETGFESGRPSLSLV